MLWVTASRTTQKGNNHQYRFRALNIWPIDLARIVFWLVVESQAFQAPTTQKSYNHVSFLAVTPWIRLTCNKAESFFRIKSVMKKGGAGAKKTHIWSRINSKAGVNPFTGLSSPALGVLWLILSAL